MAKNWTADQLATLETKVAALQSAKASSPSTWWTGTDRPRAIRMKENLTGPGAPDNLMSAALVQSHKALVSKLSEII